MRRSSWSWSPPHEELRVEAAPGRPGTRRKTCKPDRPDFDKGAQPETCTCPGFLLPGGVRFHRLDGGFADPRVAAVGEHDAGPVAAHFRNRDFGPRGQRL